MAKQKKFKSDTVTEKELREAIEASGGIVSSIAVKLGISRQTFYNWCESYPWIRQELKSSREKLKDDAECKLVENVKSGEQRAIEYILDHMAIDRGYGKKWKMQISGDSSAPIEIVVKRANSND